MITSLDELPVRSRSWLGALETEDPVRYADLADRRIVETARCPFRVSDLDGPVTQHGSVLRVLDRLDLTGREIGVFTCAPSTANSPEARLQDYRDRQPDGGPGLLHLGTYGPDRLISTEDRIALLTVGDRVTTPVAPTFEAFVLAQANAYDAWLDRAPGEVEGYWAVADECAGLEVFTGVDVGLVFGRQLLSPVR